MLRLRELLNGGPQYELSLLPRDNHLSSTTYASIEIDLMRIVGPTRLPEEVTQP